MARKKKDDRTERFLAGKKALVVDESVGVRATAIQILKDFGMAPLNLFMATNFDDAKELVKKHLPEIIITEYSLGKGTGLDLFRIYREHRPGYLGSIAILATRNARESSVAEAIDESVDCYLLKPITKTVLKAYIEKLSIAKLNPDPFSMAMARGRAALEQGDQVTAMRFFSDALKINPSSAFALFHLGQMTFERGDLKGAEIFFKQGLSVKPNHYKCLMGLFELLLSQSRNAEAFEIVKKILGHLPLSPTKLDSVIRLFVMNKAYDDLGQLYDYYLTLDERPPSVVKGMLAAMVVAVAYYLEKGNSLKAIEWANKAMVSSGRATWVFREVISGLVTHKCISEAEQFLKEMPSDQKNSMDFAVMDYWIFNEIGTPAQIVEKGRKLIAEGYEDPSLFQILSKRSAELGYKDAAELLLIDLKRKWPHFS